jgi:hypothetical protein
MTAWKRLLPAAGIVLLAIALTLGWTRSQSKFLDASGPYLGQAPPGTRAERFAPGILPHDLHSTPAFSPDGTWVYWKEMEGQHRLTASHLRDGRWMAPRGVSLGLFLFDADDPAFAPDGDTLYFTSWRPVKWYRPLPHKERIWHTERRSVQRRRWQRPQPLSDSVNAMELHWQFSLAENGALYFASQGDLYRAPLVDGQHALPQRLGPAVNASSREGVPSREGTPFVAPDERYLIFSSNRTEGSQGSEDLYASFRGVDGTWSPAVNLGPAVNSAAPELCPRVSPDGNYLFFLSARSGTYDAYWIDAQIVEQLRPANLSF